MVARDGYARGVNDSTRVAAIIPAENAGDTIAATIRACRAIPRVDLVLVVDDGSDDDTGNAARNAGAVVVRHSVNRGRSSAMETGGSVVAMRDIEGRDPRLLLFVGAALGEDATSLAALVQPVADKEADLTIAVPPHQAARPAGPAVRLARNSIFKATGWATAAPLATDRCITREAFAVASPLARDWGVEVGMTIDTLTAGFTALEVPCDVSKGRAETGASHPAARYRDIAMAVASRRMRGVQAPREVLDSAERSPSVGTPYAVAYE